MTQINPTPKLRRDAIVEVIFELRFDSSSKGNSDDVRIALSKILGEQYPTEELINTSTFKITINPASGQAVQTLLAPDEGEILAEIVTHRYRSLDGTHLYQLGSGILAFNWVTPYPGFESYFAELLRILKILHEAIGITNYKRLGLRYINHFVSDKDNPVVTWTFPQPPKFLQNEDISTNLHQITLRYNDGFQRISTVYPQNNENVISLDIDHFLEFPEPIESNISGLPDWVILAHRRIYQTFTSAVSPAFLEENK